jgi:hypothetical protein
LGQDVLLELGAEVFAPPRVVREVAVTLCCVCITVLLALLGVVSAGCAFLWAADLYDGYRCWFRLAGLTVVVVLAWVALRSAKCAAWLVGTARRG